MSIVVVVVSSEELQTDVAPLLIVKFLKAGSRDIDADLVFFELGVPLEGMVIFI